MAYKVFATDQDGPSRSFRSLAQAVKHALRDGGMVQLNSGQTVIIDLHHDEGYIDVEHANHADLDMGNFSSLGDFIETRELNDTQGINKIASVVRRLSPGIQVKTWDVGQVFERDEYKYNEPGS